MKDNATDGPVLMAIFIEDPLQLDDTIENINKQYGINLQEKKMEALRTDEEAARTGDKKGRVGQSPE